MLPEMNKIKIRYLLKNIWILTSWSSLLLSYNVLTNKHSFSIYFSFGSIETTSPVGMHKVSESYSSDYEYMSITMKWTPTNGQRGVHTFCFQAKISNG